MNMSGNIDAIVVISPPWFQRTAGGGLAAILSKLTESNTHFGAQFLA